MTTATNGAPRSKAARLKAMLNGPKIVAVPGVYDGFSCRLIQAAGFEHAAISGSASSESRLAKPDVGLMGLEENLAGARSMAASVDIPLLADADTGYGNAINTYYTVQAFEKAGVAGVMLEDQVWPKRCGHMAGKEVIPADEMVQKIRAAADARHDPDFIIKARTDAAGPLGIDEAIRRANLYAEAGADLLFADALLSPADIEKFVKHAPKPVAVNMGFGIRERKTTPLMSATQLEDLGVRAVNFPRMLTAAALRGMMNAIDALKESLTTGKVVNRPDLLVSFEELNDLMGLPHIHDLEQRYLTALQLASKYGS